MNKSYFSILPANVRYDEELPANAKLLYSEITALCNENGYCWATNEYFAKLYKVDTRTITRWVKTLQDKNYISFEVLTKRYDDGTVKKIRKIYIDKNIQNHIDNFAQNQVDKNVLYNNTNNNNNKEINISNDIFKEKPKKSTFIPPTLEEVKQYCKERNNNVDSQAFYDYYSVADWRDSQGNKIKNWKQKIITWEKKNNTTTTKQVTYSDTFSTEGRRQFNDEYFKEHPY